MSWFYLVLAASVPEIFRTWQQVGAPVVPPRSNLPWWNSRCADPSRQRFIRQDGRKFLWGRFDRRESFLLACLCATFLWNFLHSGSQYGI